VLKLNFDGIVLMTGEDLQPRAGIKTVITASSPSRGLMLLFIVLKLATVRKSWSNGKEEYHNLKLTFDGETGKLKAAEVIA
jgi:hypothetical protein